MPLGPEYGEAKEVPLLLPWSQSQKKTPAGLSRPAHINRNCVSVFKLPVWGPAVSTELPIFPEALCSLFSFPEYLKVGLWIFVKSTKNESMWWRQHRWRLSWEHSSPGEWITLQVLPSAQLGLSFLRIWSNLRDLTASVQRFVFRWLWVLTQLSWANTRILCCLHRISSSFPGWGPE